MGNLFILDPSQNVNLPLSPRKVENAGRILRRRAVVASSFPHPFSLLPLGMGPICETNTKLGEMATCSFQVCAQLLSRL